MERVRACAALAVVMGMIAAAPAAATTSAPARDVAPRAVTALPSLDAAIVARLNAVRAARGLRRLAIAGGLAAAAQQHSRELARTGLFRHESADGSPFWQRLRTFYGAGGFRSWNVGETLVWQSGEETAAGAVSAWLASPPHRHILLDPAWREVAVASVAASAAPGDFDGLDVTIVTADFGARTR